MTTPSQKVTRKDRMIDLRLGDCLGVMKEMEDKSVDLILTDPPYGMNYQSSWRIVKFEKIKQDNSIEWFYSFAKEAYRVLKENTHIYVFCNEYAISHFRDWLELAGFTNKRTLVWIKNNHTSGDLEGDYGNMTEFVLYAHKGRRKLKGNRDTNVIKTAKEICNHHPTQKPVNLCRYLIDKSSNEGEVIFDPFMGSGTTGIASKELKRGFIGIELDPTYFEIAKKRIEGAQEMML